MVPAIRPVQSIRCFVRRRADPQHGRSGVEGAHSEEDEDFFTPLCSFDVLAVFESLELVESFGVLEPVESAVLFSSVRWSFSPRLFFARSVL